MARIQPGTVAVAQVITRIGDVAAALWLLDHKLRYLTFIPRVKECAVGDIVFCRISSCDKIDKMLKAGTKTREAYAAKAFDFSNV